MTTFYSLETLQKHDALPADVDRNRREDYLTDDDFLAAFKMTRAKFASEPGWRQKHMKKNLKLV